MWGNELRSKPESERISMKVRAEAATFNQTKVVIMINAYLRLENRVVCMKFLAFKYVFIIFFETNHMIIYICTS